MEHKPVRPNADRKRCTATERDCMMGLHLMHVLTLDRLEPLIPRCKELKVKNGTRDIGMIKYAVDDLYRNVVDTIPVEQLKSLLREIKMSSYVIGVRSPNLDTDAKNYGTYISWEALGLLLDTVLHECCMMCNKNRMEQRMCKLRKTLDNISNDSEPTCDGSCQYKYEWGIK